MISQRILGKDIQGKNGSPRMIISVPCMIDRLTLKSPRESSLFREKRVCKLCSPSIFCAVLSETVPVGFGLIWRHIVQALLCRSKTRLHGSQHISSCKSPQKTNKFAFPHLIDESDFFPTKSQSTLGIKSLSSVCHTE